MIEILIVRILNFFFFKIKIFNFNFQNSFKKKFGETLVIFLNKI